MTRKRIRYTEAILVILVWMLLVAGPVFLRNDDLSNWRDKLIPLDTGIPLALIFLLNRFLLVPQLLFKKRSGLYTASIIGLIALFTISSYFVFGAPQEKPRPPRSEMMDQPPPPDRSLENDFRPPDGPKNRGKMPVFFNLLIFSILLVGFDTGLMSAFRLAETEREKTRLEKENVGAQLAFLRNQVSPHFFMNTLNNIHSLIDFNTEEAKESIIRLSKLMRHLLYDSEVEKIPIRKEVEFIQNYVDLMKLRYSDKVKINLNTPGHLPDKLIPPLLFTSFVENAFKHGISYQKASHIDISFTSEENQLTFDLKNSKAPGNKEQENSGIGIQNSIKRLDLIYGKNYTLKIEENQDDFYVTLTIPYD